MALRAIGRESRIKASSDGGTTYVAQGLVKSWTYNNGRQDIDLSAQGDTSMYKRKGLADSSGSFSSFWDYESIQIIQTAALTGASIKIQVYPNLTDTVHYYEMDAEFDLSIVTDVNSGVEINGTFSGANAAWEDGS